MHGRNDFAERSKILAGYRKVVLLNYQNNYVERSNQNIIIFCSIAHYF